MREVYTRREAIVASLLGLALVVVVWGPVLLRPFGYAPLADLRTFQLPDGQRPVQARPSVTPIRVAKARPTTPVDINHADVTALQTLPGIGPTLAGRIVTYREAHGPFQEVDALMEVEGIGSKRFEKLRPWLEAR